MSHRLLFDIEGNDLLQGVTKVHCIAAADPDTRERFDWGPDKIPQALETLSKADVLCAHYGLGYDFPALEKVHGFKVPAAKQKDTVVIARLLRPAIKATDRELLVQGKLDKDLVGKHSLKAWGQRIGIHKTDYEGGFEAWTPLMHSYMVDDVSALLGIWDHLKPDTYSQLAIDLEHRIARVCMAMEVEGWPFDEAAAHKLHALMLTEQHVISKELIAQFGVWLQPATKTLDEHGFAKMYVPKRDRRVILDPLISAPFPMQYVKDTECVRLEQVQFNPSSRAHIFRCLQGLGWKPTEFTDSGNPEVSDETLNAIGDEIPQAAKLARYLMLDKRLGQLVNGRQAWLAQVTDEGKIHARYNPMGTVTGRASHFNPNIGQVPAIKDRKGRVQPFGKECRALFTVPEGWDMLGADMEGLELRCLAHYLFKYDNGEYEQVILNGDIHTFNQKAAGLDDRQQAKTFIYAWLYGAGGAKIGSIVGGNAQTGYRLSNNFMSRIPAVGILKQQVTKIYNATDELPGLDGRRLAIRSEHSALNFLLQSAGAILCKQWVSDAFDALLARGFRHGWNGDFVFLGWIHDEVQIAVRKGLAEEVGNIVVECARAAGTPFGFRVKLDSKASKPGRTWADTH